MKAFTDTPVSKEQLLASLHAHRAADRLAKGHYWDDGKGCAVGCSLHDFAPGSEDLHAEYERLFGIPAALARLEDVIFENLPARAAQKWPVRFAEAIPEGADLSRVVPAFLVKLIERVADHPGCGGVHINEVLAVLREWRDTGTPDTARAAAATTAWAAADAAKAATTAWAAAEAAERVTWGWIADTLIDCLKAGETEETN